MSRKCPKSWIDSYLDYTQATESPQAFHTWTAISIISASLQRRVWIPRVRYTIYPNLYIILVAESSKCKKSTALAIGKRVLDATTYPPVVFAQKITPEALIQALNDSKSSQEDDCSGAIIADELSVFLSRDALNSGIISMLTNLYDSPSVWQYHTRQRGRETLTDVTLSMLAATTTGDIREILSKQAILGGFTARLILVYQSEPSHPVLFGDLDSEGNPVQESKQDVELKRNLIDDLTHIEEAVVGPLTFTKEARDVAQEWYIREFKTQREREIDGYYARKHDTMFKVATVLSLAEDDRRVIEKKHIRKALWLLQEVEVNLGYVVSAVQSTETGGLIEKILDVIKHEGEINHTKLLRKCWRFATAAEVSEMLRTLIESGEIVEICPRGSRSRYYKVKE